MSIVGSTTNENGDILLISLQEPYLNVTEIVSFNDETIGEDTSCFYNKFFRWGIDGSTYSDWTPLTNDNLAALSLDSDNQLWLQYKYEHIGDCTLEFNSISLEVVTDGGVICKVPQIKCCDGQDLTGSQNLVVDCCESTFNPYDISKAVSVYKQLSQMTSDIFGFCVKYFKTAADQRSRDVILKEYTLFDVIKSDEVKILLPDNELPTREMQFNPLMIDFPVQFEIHIVKSSFEKVFGVGAKPEMRDYLYFEQFMNRMYEVDAIAEADDFLYSGSYWRVSLVPYQQRTAVLFSDKNIEDETAAIVTSVEEEFSEERNAEFDDVRKPNQYNTIGSLANDYVRRVLDKKLLIKEYDLYNNWTIISKYHYDLSSMDIGSETLEYRFNQGWSSSDLRSFTAWFRPKYINPIGENILINSIVDDNGFVKFVTSGLPTQTGKTLSVGDWIYVKGTQSYNGIHKIISINLNEVTVNQSYIDSIIFGTPKLNKESSNEFIVYESDTQKYFSLTHTINWFIIEINQNYYKYRLSSQNTSLSANKWYAFVINLNNISGQLSLFLYETQLGNTGILDPERSSVLLPIFIETKPISEISVPNEHSWKLLASNIDLTNIRIWKKPIEEELHDLILSQYVVRDTHLTLLVDNATPQLLVNRQTNPR